MKIVPKASISCPDGRELVALMKGRNVRRVHAQLPIWEIKATGVVQGLVELIGRSPSIRESYDERRVAVLASFIRAGERSFLICDRGLMLALEGAARSDSGEWELGHEVDAQRLFNALCIETWQLYGRAKPICDGDDVCLDLMRRPEQTMESMVEYNISYVIDAFHDNEPWRVALNPKNAKYG